MTGRPQPLWFIDHLLHIRVSGEDSRGALGLLDERGRRGDMPPLHEAGIEILGPPGTRPASAR